MQFENKDIVKILLRAFNNEKERITRFDNSRKDFLWVVTTKDLELNEYRKIRRDRLWYVAAWFHFGTLPDEPNENGCLISYKEYEKKYLESPFLCTEDQSVDLLSIFEDKMLEAWQQKIKETQVRERV